VLPALLAGLGVVGGFFSGLLGIGGGIVMVPLLLFVPRLLGLASLDMRDVAGMTIVQVFAASLLGYGVHYRRRQTSGPVVRWMGGAMTLGAAAGGVTSRYVGMGVLEGAFVVLALLAAPLLFVPSPADEPGTGPAADFSPALAATSALTIGFLSGLIGVGGAFLVIPVMIYGLGLPTRIAIGSSLGVLVVSSLAAAVAKLATRQIPIEHAVLLCAGALPGAWMGASVGARVPARRLRLGLAVLVAITALRMAVDLAVTRGAALRPAGTP
jgi:uncharacterized protein